MLVCGIDEAGRAPLAGPVTAAAVVLPPEFPVQILNDSKLLRPAKRIEAAGIIKRQAVAWAIGWAWPLEIDRLNIHFATLLAMSRALEGVYPVPEMVLVDGLYVPSCSMPARAVVKGDRSEVAIMAASILAKTERDFWMVDYAGIEPRYGFEIHKGYPTRQHRERLQRYGPCAIHRRSFTVSSPG